MLQLPPSQKPLSSAEAATSRGVYAMLLLILATTVAAAQTAAPAAQLKIHLPNLSSIDYATRTTAARMIRRLPIAEAVPALTEAVRTHADEFVRYRALVVLTSFNDRGTADLMRSLLRDRNDRVREVAYKWFEANPDGRLMDTLLAALQTEQAEFVRPALVGTLAALGNDPSVQRAMLAEVSRGLDFFRSAVIDALGRHQATYAIDAISGVAKLEGPLQDDAVLALGRLGGTPARAALAAIPTPAPDLVPTIRAAQCLMGEGCDAAIQGFSDAATRPGTPITVTRASISALATVAATGHRGATEALVGLRGRGGEVRARAALGLAAAAVRTPDHVIAWLDAAPATVRDESIELLKEGFEDLEEDFGEEMFFAAARAAYWKADEGSATRTLTATLIEKLEF